MKSSAGVLGGRTGYVLLAFVILVSACGSGTQSDTDQTAGPTSTQEVDTTTTSAPETTTTTTTEPPPTTTTIASPEPLAIEPPEGYELVWNDEFDGDTIDRSNWTYDIGGWGWGNGEAQYYTDRPDNARVQNGLLVIEADSEQFEGSYYTSARLLTQGLREFQYGYIEARIKVPDGVGTWPAFWMLGANFGRETEDPDDSNWPDVGEIDIMEYAGQRTGSGAGDHPWSRVRRRRRSHQVEPTGVPNRRRFPHVRHRLGLRRHPLVLRRRALLRQESETQWAIGSGCSISRSSSSSTSHSAAPWVDPSDSTPNSLSTCTSTTSACISESMTTAPSRLPARPDWSDHLDER